MTDGMRAGTMFAALSLAVAVTAAGRQELTLRDGWLFSRDSVEWTSVTVPHDWAISGPFDKKWDLQVVAIEQNGETEKTEKSGRTGALPWLGKGYYTTTVTVPAGYDHAELLFDGAMSEPTVRVNGKYAGYWAYGYNAFTLDISPLIVQDSENTIQVSLNNIEESSRWYPGGGIYRPVTLILTQNDHFNTFGTFAYTSKLTKDSAEIKVTTEITASTDSGLAVNIALLDSKGYIVAERHHDCTGTGTISTTLDVHNPQPWTPEHPYLYKLVTTLFKNRKETDKQTVNIGIRTVSASKEGGFQLNGITRKIRGVCLHHDLGPLGAAVNKAALIRQIKTLKEMGCDAIRTAHNMPSTIQMDICDSLGMMVMAESFDMWKYAKVKNGYARFFNDWSDKDITNLVLNHRNHPSIVMWSIGNEIPEQGMAGGADIAYHLQGICHSLDPSRPVTQGMDRPDNAIKTGFAQVMDIPGFNYRLHKYSKGLSELPQGFLLGSETASTVSSRGVYKFPVTVSNNATYDDGQCTSYDTEYCSWSNLPDDDWRWQDDYDQVIGEFVWTGYDYLGEPTPYDEYWPSRSSYFGICDLAGLPKDRYFLYRSKWNTTAHTVHLLPHWTWPGREGEVTPVYCYTDGTEGELFVNGKSQGRIKKNKEGRLDRYRLRWNDVIYEPGEIKVVAYDENGNVIGTDTRRTAGAPVKLNLYADRTTIAADGDDLAFITVSLSDSTGTVVPTATDQMTFTVSGDGVYQAACNGDATSLEPFTEPAMRLFSGQLVVIVRSTKNAGTMRLSVTDQERGLSGSIDIQTTAM